VLSPPSSTTSESAKFPAATDETSDQIKFCVVHARDSGFVDHR
jgi:hypothetical protein